MQTETFSRAQQATNEETVEARRGVGCQSSKKTVSRGYQNSLFESQIMSYARSRLWLGISGVGSLVVLSSIALTMQLPGSFLPSDTFAPTSDGWGLLWVFALLSIWLLPFDLLGGYILPRRFERTTQGFAQWLGQYGRGVGLQALVYFSTACLILLSGRTAGLVGVLLVILVATLGWAMIRDLMLHRRKIENPDVKAKLQDAIEAIQSWQIFVPRTIVVDHEDEGFTGGIIGLGNYTTIVIPKLWLDTFSADKLAVVIARRATAINRGSYFYGLAFACTWNVVGFMLCTLLPGADVVSVAGLVTVACGFAIWSFLGLLTLPSVSRGASLQVDDVLNKNGAAAAVIKSTAYEMDKLQDAEPDRPKLIETIFHPIPNVTSRGTTSGSESLAAWNVARMALLQSWICFGFLSRCVHCNVGRPELWTMLPSD